MQRHNGMNLIREASDKADNHTSYMDLFCSFGSCFKTGFGSCLCGCRQMKNRSMNGTLLNPIHYDNLYVCDAGYLNLMDHAK